MKALSNKDIQAKNDTDLKKDCVLRGEELLKLRFKGAGAGPQDAMTVRNLKKDIARIKTEIRSRELSDK